MSHESSDFCRRLLVLGADLVDVQKEQSALANWLLDLKENSEYEYFEAELKELQTTFKRVRHEFITLFEGLQDGDRKKTQHNSDPGTGD